MGAYGLQTHIWNNNWKTVLLMADKELAHVSSTLVKQIVSLADDEELSHFVPPTVIAELRSKMKRGKVKKK